MQKYLISATYEIKMMIDSTFIKNPQKTITPFFKEICVDEKKNIAEQLKFEFIKLQDEFIKDMHERFCGSDSKHAKEKEKNSLDLQIFDCIDCRIISHTITKIS